MQSIVEVEQLVKRFGQVVALQGVSFAVKSGEIFGFLGPNGAGKSTTINILATLLTPTSGRAVLNGFDVTREADAVRRSIGMVFQDPSLDDRLTARENLELHGILYGMDRASLAKKIDEGLRMVELEGRQHDPVRTFSGGMKRRLEIARGLLHAPAVLFLDEPTIGLDPQTRNYVWQYIHRLKEEERTTVFLTTHYMDEAEHCDRIAIIDHGEIVALDTPAELKRRVSGDVVLLKTADADTAQRVIANRFGLSAIRENGELRLEVPDGESFIPKLFRELSDILSIRLRKPTLDDVFIKLTGRAIRDESAGAIDQLRQHSRMWRRGR